MTVVWEDPDTFTSSSDHPLGFRVRFADDLLHSGADRRDLWGAQRHSSRRRLVFIERNIARIYGQQFRAMFVRHGLDCHFVRVPGGERTKNLFWLWRSLRHLDKFDPLRTDEPIIIIGSGVVIDREGFAAGLIRRGVPTYLVCTDEMTIGDAGPTQKRAVDFRGKKNRIGLFVLQPQEVYVCRPLQRTEPYRVAASGAVESIKLGLVTDADLFALWEKHGARVLAEAFQGLTDIGDQAADAINRQSAAGISAEHAANRLEANLNKATYIGHTISTVLEMVMMRLWWRRFLRPTRLRRDDLLHGEAVAHDLLITAAIALGRGLLSPSEFDRLVDVFDRIGVPLWNPLLANWRLIERGLADATKHRNGNLRLPLPDGIGQCTFATDVTMPEVKRAIAHVYTVASARHGLSSPFQRQRRPKRLGPAALGPARSGPTLLARRWLRRDPLRASAS